jgi:hypothetical protein
MVKKLVLAIAMTLSVVITYSQTDSAKLEKLRAESGVDPTRVQSRAGYSFIIYDQKNSAGQINNKLNLTLGINRWSFAAKYEVISSTTGIPGSGFTSGMGDIKFSVLNAFYVKGKNALAMSAEFSMPTGKPEFGSQYFSATPALTYSYTIKSTLIFAIQPQYTFALMKDPAYPELSVLTIRSFLANFRASGLFLVFEVRPVMDLENENTDLILSPIIGKSLGGGFNIIFLSELPVTENYRNTRGNMFQFGFNKNF